MGGPFPLNAEIVLIGIGILYVRIEEAVALAERIWGRHDRTAAQAKRILCGSGEKWIIQIAGGQVSDVGPALRKVSAEADHRSPVVKKSSISGAKDGLVVNTIGEPYTRLDVVVGVLNNPTVGGHGNMVGQRASWDARSSLGGGTSGRGILEYVCAIIQVNVSGDVAMVASLPFARPVGDVVSKSQVESETIAHFPLVLKVGAVYLASMQIGVHRIELAIGGIPQQHRSHRVATHPSASAGSLERVKNIHRAVK